MTKNEQLRQKNKRLSDAVLTLVDRIETVLPTLKQTNQTFERRTGGSAETAARQAKAKRQSSRREYSPPPKMEIFETFHEPIEFAEPAPEMHFGSTSKKDAPAKETSSRPKWEKTEEEYSISPDLAPEEIDLLKSPTRDKPRQKPARRETVEVVDLHPRESDPEAGETYEAGASRPFEIPEFEFEDDEPVVDIKFDHRETLRAAMRRRVNRLRW
ncbi:hypothetical protein [Sneathiella sp.]|uniref:hypothetical protein n=1 Tax=Sneathiella sp. TaxID=1964365 RepID=UPI0035661E05